jgi:hypothetical protein
MRQRLLSFVVRQRVFDEGVELVRVWMVPGLEEIAHIGSDALVVSGAVSLENELI